MCTHTESMDRDDVVDTCNGVLLRYKKEQNHAIRSNTDGPGDDPSVKWARDKLHMMSLRCRIFKCYKWTYLQNSNRLTDIENKLWLPVEKGWGRNESWI